MTEIIEGTAIEETVQNQTAIKPVAYGQPANLFGARSMAAVMVGAKEAAKILAAELEPTKERPRPLYKKIGERRHVYIEGWTLLGSLLGVTPVTVWTRQILSASGEWRPPIIEQRPRHSKFCKKGAQRNGEADHPMVEGCEEFGTQPVVIEPGLGGWEARVEARNSGGREIGAAEAECRWDESSWRDRDSYALRSMAQTRASSKALRMPLGFVVELAGYNATPAEEIPEGEVDDSGPKCPSCGSALWDNREQNRIKRENGADKTPPAFKCRNKSCTGGRNGEPWITWHDNFFAMDRRATQERNTLKNMILNQLVKDHHPMATEQFGGLVAEEEGGVTKERPPKDAEMAKRAYEAACEHVGIDGEPSGATELDMVWNAAKSFFGIEDGAGASPFQDAKDRVGDS